MAYIPWKEALAQWEEFANNDAALPVLDLHASISAGLMDTAISILDEAEVPTESKQFHNHIRKAMVHERTAFLSLQEYYELGAKRPYDAARADAVTAAAAEAWAMKDKELAAAEKVLP